MHAKDGKVLFNVDVCAERGSQHKNLPSGTTLDHHMNGKNKCLQCFGTEVGGLLALCTFTSLYSVSF